MHFLSSGRNLFPMVFSIAPFLMTTLSMSALSMGTASSASAALIRVPQDIADLQTAIDTAVSGDVIEIANGTYIGTFTINATTAEKDLTLRAAEGAQVTLSGGGTTQVLRYQKTAPSGTSIVFQGLTFADGFSDTNGLAGGVTVTRGNATFIDCTFLDNATRASSTGGGGLFAFDQSVIHVFDSVFDGNSSQISGGGLRIGDGISVFVHNSRFTDNSTAVSGHIGGAAGGAIHMANADLQVSNSRFEGNRAGCVGAGVFVLGSPWEDPVGVPKATARIVNSTFSANSTSPAAGASCDFTPVGGAIHSENQAEIFVINSRFEKNSAASGGAITQYRSKLTVEESVFRGNRATGASTSQGFGGSILSNSNDAVDDTTAPNGQTNRPSATLTIRDSLFQGRYEEIGTTGVNGGCLYVEGDANRTYGRFGVPAGGSLATNRAQVTIEGSVFADCDVTNAAGGVGKGGAISVSHTDLDMDGTLIFESDADGGGGGLWALIESTVDIASSTFAYCSGEFGGAINASGSNLDIASSTFFGNEASLQGSAIWTAESPDGATGLVDMDATGTVQSSTFADNGDSADEPDIYDRDKNTAGDPINRMTYLDNDFWDNNTGSIFTVSIAGTHNVSGLNSLVVSHPQNGVNVDKGSGNTALGSRPDLGALLAVPAEILPTAGADDPMPSTNAYLAYAWNGGSATLDGTSLGGDRAGLLSDGAGVHTLAVGAESFLAEITNGPEPAASFSVAPSFIDSGFSADLDWSTTAGTFLEMSIDRGTSTTSAASGSVTVSPTETTEYQLYVLTREGGTRETGTLFVDEIPGVIFTDGFESGNAMLWSSSVGGP